mmetsp:Transcript_2587/g.5242  ORF Transcript_2587/g.5242 Transcript_2587/m.5242 type:complete len:128 (-) Transcript_2587:338-721(-)
MSSLMDEQCILCRRMVPMSRIYNCGGTIRRACRALLSPPPAAWLRRRTLSRFEHVLVLVDALSAEGAFGGTALRALDAEQVTTRRQSHARPRLRADAAHYAVVTAPRLWEWLARMVRYGPMQEGLQA